MLPGHRAVVATAFGGPENLAVVPVEGRDPGPGEVTVRVRAAGVNPVDAKLYAGVMGADPAKLPMRLGFEAAGVVTAVGRDAGLAVGDEVIAFRVTGAYADELTVRASSLTPKPAGVGWAEAAGLMLTGATAVHALTAAEVVAGETVLVHAAAGGVGLMLVQLARLRGARVVGTASTAKHDLLRGLGAEPVAYGDGLVERVRSLVPDGVGAAVDAVGSDEAVDASLALVGDRARIVTIAAFGRAADAGIRAIGGGPGADPGTELRDAARPELARLLGEGALRVLVADELPLDDAAEAHRRIRGGRTTGKLVLVP